MVAPERPHFPTWKFKSELTPRQRATYCQGGFVEPELPPVVVTYRGPATCRVVRAERHPLADFRQDRLGLAMARALRVRLESLNEALAEALGGSPRMWVEEVIHDCLWVEHPVGSEKWHCCHGLNHRGSHGNTQP